MNNIIKMQIILKLKILLKVMKKYRHPVVLKSLNDSSNINEDFLNEVSSHTIFINNYNSLFLIIINVYF